MHYDTPSKSFGIFFIRTSSLNGTQPNSATCLAVWGTWNGHERLGAASRYKKMLQNVRQYMRDAPIISIGRLVRWCRPTVVYTIGKHKFLFLLPKAETW